MIDQPLPAPLVPPDVDLRDFGFMPLHVQRLRDSELVDLSTGDEFKAAVLLWAYAWHQQPAASVPDDDRILAARSGAGALWRKVKAMALRGFVKCSDGRLYHPLIAEAAIEAWRRREEYQESQENREDRKERYRARLKELSAALRALGVRVPKDRSIDALERALEDAKRGRAGFDSDLAGDIHEDASGDGSGDASGDAAGTLRGRPPGDACGRSGDALDRDRDRDRDKREESAQSVRRSRARSPEVGPDLAHGPDPSAGGQAAIEALAQRVCQAMARTGFVGANPGDARLVALLTQGAAEVELVGIAAEAVPKRKGWPWVLATCKARREDAAAMVLPHGPGPGGVVVVPPADTVAEYVAKRDAKLQAEQLTPEQQARAAAAAEAALVRLGRRPARAAATGEGASA